MTQWVREWLPVGVTDRDAVRTRIAGAVDQWSTHWFPKRRVRVQSYAPRFDEAPDTRTNSGWRLYGGVVAINASRKTASRILDWALDARLDLLILTEMDRRLVDALELKMLRDLASLVEKALGIEGQSVSSPQSVDAPYGPLGGLGVELADGQGAPLLALAAPLHALLALCKSSLPPRMSQRAPLTTPAKAIGPTMVAVDASLGVAELSLAELQSLAPGDVLILSRTLDEGPELLIAGSGEALGSTTLTDLDGRRAVAFQA